jgi:carbamoyl-phosphate synthase large subunit
MITIMLTSIGRRVKLAETLREDAAGLGRKARIVGADVAPRLSSGCALADEAIELPACTAPNYGDIVREVCSRIGIDMVIPTIDTELQPLAEAAPGLAEIGTTAVVSSLSAVATVRDKLQTARTLEKAGIRVPDTYLVRELAEGHGPTADMIGGFIAKPRDGSNSVGMQVLTSICDPAIQQLDGERFIVQRRCIGPEYTVNCFVDRLGMLRAAVPHRRLQVRGGEVSKAATERHASLLDVARLIVLAVPGLRGPFCFQAFLEDEGPTVIEINARFGGGYPLAHRAGATFGRWLLEERLGLACTAHDLWTERLLMLRYDEAVFLAPEAIT